MLTLFLLMKCGFLLLANGHLSEKLAEPDTLKVFQQLSADMERYADNDTSVLANIKQGFTFCEQIVQSKTGSKEDKIYAGLLLSRLYSTDALFNQEKAYHYIKLSEDWMNSGSPGAVVEKLKPALFAQKAICEYFQGNADGTILYYNKALSALKKYPSDLIYRRVYTGLGFIYKRTEVREYLLKAIHYYKLAIEYSKKLKRPVLVAELMFKVAEIYAVFAEKENNRIWALKADSLLNLSYDQLKTDKISVGATYYVIKATTLLHLKQPREVLLYADSALKAPVLKGFNYVNKENYVALMSASAHLMLGNYEKAKKSLAIADIENATPDRRQMAYDIAYKTYEALKEDRQALQYLGSYYHIKDSLSALAIDERLIEMTKKYDVAKKDADIARLEAARAKDRVWVIAAAGIFVCIGIGALVSYRSGKRKLRETLQKIEDITEVQELKIQNATNDAKNEERVSLGMLLHDELAATMSATSHFLQNHLNAINDPSEKNRWIRIIDSLGKSYNTIRHQSHQLFNSDQDQNKGFMDAVVQNIQLYFYKSTIQAEIQVEPFESSISEEIQLTILATIKEAATNIFKHSQATQAHFLLYEERAQIYIVVNDNGKGPGNHKNKKGIGLSSLAKRAARLKGTISITKVGTGGTELVMRLPAEKEKEVSYIENVV